VVFYVENADVAQRDVTNVLRPVGATPTMFPMYFYTDYGDDEILPGMSDLAPDDIAAISYLYRRPGGKDNYFDLPLNAPQQIRTTTGHPNIPSAPVYGAHIVAWCDVDNDPDTPRVPLFSTMSGMYKNSEGLSGQFTIEGMLKEMETMGGAGPFQATYTITASPLNGDDDADLQRQAPPDYTAADFQSVEGAFINAAGSWLSEVFHESAKIYDISNYDVGTPLAYDSTRGYIVSADTGKTLQTILPGTRSMFGTSLDDRICPYNVVVQKAGVGGVTAGSLRHLRDGVLLKTGLGSAFARLYYSVAPWLAEQLMEHEWLLSGAATVMRATDWVLVHAGLVVKMVLGMLAFIVVLVHARRRLYMRTAMIVVLAVGLATAPATALMMRFSDEEIVTAADEVIEVTVEHVESRWMKKGSGRQIITDVTVRVEDALKGDVETGSVLTFQNLGGRVDNVVMKVEHMPTFRVGDSAILSLEKREGVGRIVFGGVQGKVDITTGSDGTRYVHKAIPEDSDAHVKSSQAATGEGTGVSVQTFKEYIREILNDAEAQP